MVHEETFEEACRLRELKHLPESIRTMLSVDTYGAPWPIHPSLAGSVTNHVDPKDFVALPSIQHMQHFCYNLGNLPSPLQMGSSLLNHSDVNSEYNIRYTPVSGGHCFFGDGYKIPFNQNCNDYNIRVAAQAQTNFGDS